MPNLNPLFATTVLRVAFKSRLVFAFDFDENISARGS